MGMVREEGEKIQNLSMRSMRPPKTEGALVDLVVGRNQHCWIPIVSFKMAILKNSLPVGFSFALCTSILLLLTFSSTPVSALELKVPSIANLRSAFGGDSLLTTSAIPNRSGPSFTYGKLVFRPYDFILEGYLFGLCFLYLLVSYAGKLRNRSLVNNWFNHAEKFLLTEFSAIADGKVGGGGGNKTLWNGGGEAVVYAGGRRNVEG